VITLTGSVHRSFTFPANVPTTCAYYGDYQRLFRYLPHIHLVKVYAPNQFRLLYDTTELGMYRVQICCDLHAAFDQKTHALSLTPLTGVAPVRSSVTVTSLTAQGQYASVSTFRAAGDHTICDYRLELKATLPRPFGLSLMPNSMVNQIASNVTQWRIREIADGFIERSIEEFRRGTPACRTRAVSTATVAPAIGG
jgi:hypothetical protein